MLVRRIFAAGAVVGLLLAAAVPVAAHDRRSDGDDFVDTVLVTGPSPDADLVNAWGLTRSPTSPWWTANNGTDSTTLYRADGSKVTASPSVPARVGIPGGAPTGTVFNPGAAAGDFNGDNFLFDGEAGVIFGWRGTLGATAEVGNGDFAG
ncbi:MAG: hypothetical protein ACHQNA_12825, partial [Acidimicrobiales bacterium]